MKLIIAAAFLSFQLASSSLVDSPSNLRGSTLALEEEEEDYNPLAIEPYEYIEEDEDINQKQETDIAFDKENIYKKSIQLSEINARSEPILNVALEGTASQSSIYYGASADRAIDGNTKGNWGDASMSSTDTGDKTPWWKVDFRKSAEISKIVVWNREDAVPERLSNSNVVIYNYGVKKAVFPIGDATNKRELTFHVDGIVGNSVVIMGGGEYLTLVEVQVIGRYLPSEQNLALQGTASQSSTYKIGNANKAIDGNTDDHWGNLSMSHTDHGDNNPWWRVKLYNNAKISKIVVWNRDHADGEASGRLSNSRIFLYNYGIKVAEFFIGDATDVRKFEFEADGIEADSVTILGSQPYLTLAEVEVLGIYV